FSSAKDVEDIRNSAQRTSDAARCVQLRGEYLYVAEGKGGFRVYDVASIANKDISDRILSAPFSPTDGHVATKNATCMALPTDQSIAPERNTAAIRSANSEQAMHPIYNYAVITDADEGLILVDINTFTDGDPRNNGLRRALTWNPGGALKGARHVTLAGHFAYVAADAGLITVDLDDPLHPKIAATTPLTDLRASAVQFRYLFATTAKGVEVLDITRMDRPRATGAVIPLADAHRIYLARTYAYVAAGVEGLAIIDIERPEAPRLYQKFTAGGALNDARDVVIGSTNASLFAYVADGRNGLKVLQLTSPESQPNFYGFSPEPKPELIAWAKTPTPAIALSRGLDRDRAVDETGHQIAVTGRLGSRPFTRPEMERFFLDRTGEFYRVTNDPDLSRMIRATRTAAR
ncbi:MAG: hypothetical protein WCI21_09705, partial [Alphaproteobacteria bacterium]